MEKTFVVVYAVEMALRIIELGLIETPTAYLKNGWNVVDFVVAWIGILYYLILSYPPKNINRAKSLIAFNTIRAARAIRPLRILRRYSWRLDRLCTFSSLR